MWGVHSCMPITFDINDLDRVGSRSLRFRNISRKGAELDHMLLLNINRKVSMESPLVQLHLTFMNLKGHCQGHSDFEGISGKGVELDHVLLLDTDRK